MSTQTNRPIADRLRGPQRPRRPATPRLEVIESRLLMATGTAPVPEISSPYPLAMTTAVAVAPPIQDPATTPADPAAQAIVPASDPAAPPAALVPASAGAKTVSMNIDYDDTLVAGDVPKQYDIPVDDSDILQFDLVGKAETPNFVAQVAVFSGAGELITSGPLASSSEANGFSRVTIVGMPHGDPSVRPGSIRVTIPPAGAGEPDQNYRLDFSIRTFSDPSDPHSMDDASRQQSVPGANGVGGWVVDMTPVSSPWQSAGTFGPATSLPSNSSQTSLSQMAPPSNATAAPGPQTSSSDPDEDMPLDPADPAPPSPSPSPTRSPGDAATAPAPAHAGPLPADTLHRPPPVDLVTADPSDSGRDGLIPLLADAAAESGGLIPTSWLAPADSAAPGLGFFASPLAWLDGPDGEASFSDPEGESPASRPAPSAGPAIPSRPTAAAEPLELTNRERSSSTPGRPVGRERAGLDAEEAGVSSDLMPILAGLGGSSALFAGLLLPDLANLLRPFLRARRGAPRPPAKGRRV